MDPNAFESRLQQTPLKQPPAEWREKILVAADACRGEAQRSPVNRRTSPIHELTSRPDASPQQAFAATWRMRLRELFWPHPVAWGAMAAVWIAIGAVHLAMREPALSAVQIHVVTSSDVPTLMSMQRELLAAWDQPVERPQAPPVRSIPPQSCIDRRRETLEA